MTASKQGPACSPWEDVICLTHVHERYFQDASCGREATAVLENYDLLVKETTDSERIRERPPIATDVESS